MKAKVREFILDSQVPNPHEISEALGCSPISDEVAEREEEESDKRLEHISHLIPLLYGYSALFAAAFINESQVFSEDVPEELALVVNKITESTKQVLEDAMAYFLVGAVSQMVDLNLLHLDEKRKK